MNILVINAGSSSLKYTLFAMESKTVLEHGVIEHIGEPHGKYSNHHEAIVSIFDHQLEVDMIAHRVVHGADQFTQAVKIDQKVIETICDLIPLAPLHNKANLDAIEVAMGLYPLLPQVAVFDTAFHQSMPKEAYLYALPYELYEKEKIRRYGFHGTSHQYLSKTMAQILQKPLETLNVITLHLGNGSSACAIKGGKSIDTSMGMSPLAGLIMGSRCGDIDSEIIFHLHQKMGLDFDAIDHILNKESGLKGICGQNDLRAIIEDSSERADLALNMYARSVKKYIGAYIALLGSVDAIIFSGGIGEHSAFMRQKIIKGFEESFNIVLDSSANEENKACISTQKSKIGVYVIATNEELEIASQALAFLEVDSK
jgi:acetate kinase